MLKYTIAHCCHKVKLSQICLGNWFEYNDKACKVIQDNDLGLCIEEHEEKVSSTYFMDKDTMVIPLTLVEAKFERI